MREMQVDRRFLQVAMSEQHLDGAQVGAGFEQMRGEAVAQRVGMNMLVREPSAFGGVLAGRPDHLGGDRIAWRYATCCRETASRWACA